MSRLLVVALISLLAACAGDPRATDVQPTLVGRIYDVAQDRFVDEPELLARLAPADFVLLGELHGNVVHHELQARVTRALQGRSTAPRAVAFEMMGTDQQLAIVEYLRSQPRDASGLGEALDWQASGWPDWRLYQPIAQAGLDANGLIVAANLPRGAVRAVFERGPSALRPAVIERTGLGEPLPPPLAAGLRAELRDAHCDELPGRVVEGMFRVQRARDAVMADRLAAVAGSGGAILIAGAGHVRRDRGVPWYLVRLRPDASLASLAFLEAGGGFDPASADLPFDFVWFTPAEASGDPCARDVERLPPRAASAAPAGFLPPAA